MTELVKKLIEFKFIPVFGVRHQFGGGILRSAPKTCGYDRGVCVVYDDVGDPWMNFGHELPKGNLAVLIAEFNLISGASIQDGSERLINNAKIVIENMNRATHKP